MIVGGTGISGGKWRWNAFTAATTPSSFSICLPNSIARNLTFKSQQKKDKMVINKNIKQICQQAGEIKRTVLIIFKGKLIIICYSIWSDVFVNF